MVVSLTRALICALGIAAFARAGAAEPRTEQLRIDASEEGVPFQKHWGDFGAEQGKTTLDPEYGRQLTKLKKGIPSFQFVRFHNILADDLVNVSRKSDGTLDFDDLDHVFGKAGDVYANLLSRKLKPYVELGFMPLTMAKSPGALHAFTYKPNMSEPKDFAEWSLLVGKFTSYLMKRFGAAEVRSWPFEIWNEYNLDFYAGPHGKAEVYAGRAFRQKELSYYKLYKAAATALKGVDSQIQIVGPGTAAVYGLKKFINWAVKNGAPLPDRISTHVYGNESPDRVLGKPGKSKDGGAAWVAGAEGASAPAAVVDPAKEALQYKLGWLAMKKARRDVLGSKAPWLADKIDFTEFNRSYDKDLKSVNPESTDRANYGPWLVDSYKHTIGVVQKIVHWVGTDYRFEELPWELQKDLADRHGGFGTMDRKSVWKAGGNVMRALAHLPDGVRLKDSKHTIVTKSKEGRVAFVAYNPSEKDALHVELKLKNVEAGSVLRLYRVDDKHGNAQPVWEALGSPKNATSDQVKAMSKAARLTSRVRVIRPGMTLKVPKNGVVVAVVEKAKIKGR